MKKILFLILLITAPLPFYAEQGPEHYFEDLQKEEPANGIKFYKQFINMLFFLALILGALFLVLLFFKRLLLTQSNKINELSRIKIVEQRSLSSKSTLYLLEMGGQTLLVAESPAGVTLLTKAPPFTLEK